MRPGSVVTVNTVGTETAFGGTVSLRPVLTEKSPPLGPITLLSVLLSVTGVVHRSVVTSVVDVEAVAVPSAGLATGATGAVWSAHAPRAAAERAAVASRARTFMDIGVRLLKRA